MASMMSEESPNAAKRPNFSAISTGNSNGISKSNLMVKTGATKKLVIKNFRGKEIKLHVSCNILHDQGFCIDADMHTSFKYCRKAQTS